LTFFDVAPLADFLSEQMVEHGCSGFEPRYFSPGHQRQTDEYYSSSDKPPGRMPDCEAYQYDSHQKQIIEDAVSSSRADGTPQFLDLSVDLPELFGWALLVSICRHHDLCLLSRRRSAFLCRALRDRL
jgi:hypothetical protein